MIELVTAGEIKEARKIIGEDLERIRIHRKMSKSDVAKRANIAYPTLLRALREGPSSIEVLLKIATALHAVFQINWIPREQYEAGEGDQGEVSGEVKEG
jgi:transcriptional regulator with XRE-family HTH domain